MNSTITSLVKRGCEHTRIVSLSGGQQWCQKCGALRHRGASWTPPTLKYMRRKQTPMETIVFSLGAKKLYDLLVEQRTENDEA